MRERTGTPEGPVGGAGKKKLSGRKKLIIALGAAAILAVGALGFAYTFLYDGFGIVGRLISWRAQLPADMTADESKSELFVTWENDYLYARVSRERSPYLDIQEYIDYYFARFYESPDWQAANGAEVLDRDSEGMKRHVTLRLSDMPEGMADTYTFVTMRTGTRYFIRALLKYDSRHEADRAQAAVDTFIRSLRPSIRLKGRQIVTDFRLLTPESWSDETKAAFEKLQNAREPYFGVFSKDARGLEEKLGHSFALGLIYFQLSEQVPLEQMEAWYAEGKLTELTMQCTVTNNLALYESSSPMLDVLKGKYDEKLAAIAADLRAFGHPVLFRLNNEMNSDWCSYSGVVNLADPELYVAVWRYIYDFFAGQGLDNLIWVWNPNDENYPPAKWNSYLAYFPGSGYVHMLGVTGYNTGTYYADVTGERWRSFEEIYGAIDGEYGQYFGDFPWMVTEFASSSVGGDKPGWIRDMFAGIGAYGRIKAAVWFDFADYDGSKPDNPVSRPYWIAETDETLAAFKEGIRDKAQRFFE